MAMDFSRRPKGFNSPTGKLDFDRTADALRARALAVCQHLLPHGRKEGSEWRVGDLNGSKGQSLGVHLSGTDTGLWKDFSAGVGGADLIALWAAVKGIKQGEAKKEADEWLGISSRSNGTTTLAQAHTHSTPSTFQPSPAPAPAEDGASTFDWKSAPPSEKWQYRLGDGTPFGIVYRWDHPGIGKGKTIRPWDGTKWESPAEARPLLYLPELIETPHATPIILVEGERKCDRLRALGFAATTFWGGSQAMSRTDWTPLVGRDVVIWPDNDKAGGIMAAKMTVTLQEAGAGSIRVCVIPDGKPAKWDARDATDTEARAIIAEALAGKPRARGYRPLRLAEWTATGAYAGDPPPRRWLVNEVFPLGVACGLAAQGDTGKGMLLLDLALKVAMRRPASGIDVNPPLSFGGRVMEFGSAVILSAEDDQGEIHRRLVAIGKNGNGRFLTDDRLMVVPLPSFGGAPALFKNDGGSVETTESWDDLMAQLVAMAELRLVVFDPLASFVRADVNADPGIGAYVCGRFAAMADALGATVLVAQHMAKGNQSKPITSAEEARHAIRGTSALVDNMRATYALWPSPEAQAKRICKTFGIDWNGSAVVNGAVVKANGPADRTIRTYLRNKASGLLEDVTARAAMVKAPMAELLDLLEDEIRRAAVEGDPFTKTGAQGVAKRKAEMAQELSTLPDNEVERLAQDLITKNKVRRCNPAGRANSLDVPKGPFALGIDSNGYPPIIKRTARGDLPEPETP